MNFERVKQQTSIEEYAADHLERKGRTYVCPACGSGTGPKGTPAFSIKDGHFRCFSCNAGGDIFDLAGIVKGTEDRREQLQEVVAWAGVAMEDDGAAGGGREADIGSPGASARVTGEKAVSAVSRPSTGKPSDAGHREGRERSAAYVAECRARVHDPEAVAYLASRGITESEAEALGLGYDPHAPRGWRDSAGARRRGGRVIIPWKGSDHYHIDRAATNAAKEGKYDKPAADEVGPQPLYNPGALKADAFFVVEGALDAIAVELCGFEAVALGGTGSRSAVEAMAARGPKGVAIVMLDADDAGRSASNALLEQLDASRIPATRADMPGHKDAAEWLAADRDSLRSFLRDEHDRAIAEAVALREERYNAAMESMRALDPLDVAASLYALDDVADPLPTGFGALDAVLNGGLQPGSLYALGAVSSYGKTTLAVQIADHVAESGHGVLFVTIEQSAREIVAKSLSRIMSECGRAYSAAEIASARRRSEWGEADVVRMRDACEAYSAGIAPRLRIYEGTRQPSIGDIAAIADAMAEHDGEPPVIFIDYLQLLAAQNDRDTDKRAVDRNVMSLRQMARDLKTPVFVISSLNRSSYSEGVTMDAFKESGAIEYGSDVLLGLQPKGMREHMEGVSDSRAKREADKLLRESKAGDTRECELVVLKNRNGRVPAKGLPLKFKPVASRFADGA